MLHPGLSETEPSGATVLAITSGKGGVGKTNIATNLAICLAGLHQRVVLMVGWVSATWMWCSISRADIIWRT